MSMWKHEFPLILASASATRLQLLTAAGLRVQVAGQKKQHQKHKRDGYADRCGPTLVDGDVGMIHNVSGS